MHHPHVVSKVWLDTELFATVCHFTLHHWFHFLVYQLFVTPNTVPIKSFSAFFTLNHGLMSVLMSSELTEHQEFWLTAFSLAFQFGTVVLLPLVISQFCFKMKFFVAIIYLAAERFLPSMYNSFAEVNISPKINISSRDSRDTLSLDSNISARTPKKAIFLHGTPKKAFFMHNWIRNSLNLHCIT